MNDSSLPVLQLTDYEKSMIESLREERRRKLGIAAAAPVRTPTEPPPQDAQPARLALVSPAQRPEDAQPAESALIGLAQPRQDAQPGPVPSAQPQQDPQPAQSAPTLPALPLQDARSAPVTPAQLRQDAQPGRPAAVPLRQDPQPVRPAPIPPAQPARHSGSRLRLTLLGSLLIVILAGAAIVMLKPDRTSKEAPSQAAAATAQPDQTVQMNSNTIADRIDKAADRTGDGEYEVSGDRVRLRNAPAETGSVLRTVRQGTLVGFKEHPAESEWCLIQLPGGREGWMKCNFLKPVAQSASGPPPRETRKEKPRP